MKQKTKKILIVIRRYATFFLLIALLATSCMMLFLNLLASELQLVYTQELISTAATLTFFNVIFLSLFITIFDAIRRKLTIDRPVKRITQAAEKMTKGDFSVRIPKNAALGSGGTFNKIIKCFNQMAEELGGVETLRTDFIANVSHEMKTPLAVMQNYGTMLQSPDLSEEERIEYAKGATDASRRLAEMMTNILKLNRLENQQIYPQRKEYDLGEQLCECLLSFENIWEQSEINIETDIAENVTVNADAELLSLVWNNLLSNAFKFTEKGGTVFVSLTATEHHAVVKVKDTGCGMSMETGNRIFDKFYQGDTSHATQGNGLGLSLVKKVIDITHGEINVESTLGVGSTFTVTIRR